MQRPQVLADVLAALNPRNDVVALQGVVGRAGFLAQLTQLPRLALFRKARYAALYRCQPDASCGRASVVVPSRRRDSRGLVAASSGRAADTILSPRHFALAWAFATAFSTLAAGGLSFTVTGASRRGSAYGFFLVAIATHLLESNESSKERRVSPHSRVIQRQYLAPAKEHPDRGRPESSMTIAPSITGPVAGAVSLGRGRRRGITATPRRSPAGRRLEEPSAAV